MEYGLLILAGIIVVVLVARFASTLGVAAPLLLVVVGAGASLIPGVPRLEVPPELILAVVLPPILYSAAVNVPLVDFRRNLKAITGLSVVLVIVSALVSGFVLYTLLPALSLPLAIALGAVISPPDAVAATAIGKRLGLPPRLVTVLEGEGLVNDATALVLLRTAIAATAGAFSFWDALGDFAYAASVAVAVGLVVGYVTVWLRSRMDNPVLTTTMSFAVPFLAYLPAEEIHASGVLAVVVAGLVTGHRSATHFSAQDRIAERINWRTAQFVLENGVFLMMGFELLYLVDQVGQGQVGQGEPGLWHSVGLGLLATAVLIVVRILFVGPLVAMLRRDERRAARKAPYVDSALKHLSQAEPTTEKQQRRHSRITRFLTRSQADNDFLQREGLGWRGGAVLAWSGMRGVVTLAAAQSLPASVPYRPQLILIAFTVAIVTLLLQGGTLPLLIRVLGIRGTDAATAQAELASLVEEISENGIATLDNPELRQNNGAPFDPEVVEAMRTESRTIVAAQSELNDATAPGPHAQRRALRLRVLQAERAALLDARATGQYSSHTLERVQSMLDLEESRLAQLEGDPGH